MSPTNPGGACCRLVVSLLVTLGVLCLLRYTHGDVIEENEEMVPRRRYAICVYGVVRAINITLPTLKRHILEPIENAGDEYDVFVHTYSMDTYSNKRTKVIKTAYTWGDDYKQLESTRSLVTNQDEFDQIVIGNYENAIQSKRWEFKERDTIMNLYRARHSLELSWEIMADYASSQGIKYDAVIALRPDMAFVSDIDIAKLQSMEEDTIYVPSWESNGGINDRFAFGQMEAMRAYMNRNEHIIPLQKKRINTEVYLKLHLTNRGKKIATTEIYLVRIRVNKAVPKRDVRMYRRLCFNDSPTYGCWMVRNNTIAPTRTKFRNQK